MKIGLKHRKSIERIDINTGEIKDYASIKSVEEDGFSSSMVQKICSGLYETYKNYFWKYKESELKYDK